MKFRKSTITNLIGAVVLALPLLFVIELYIPKYFGEIYLEQEDTNANLSYDINGDGSPERIQFVNFNEKNELYAEVWSKKSMLGVWRSKEHILRNSIVIYDLDHNGTKEIIFSSISRDTVYANRLEFRVVNGLLKVALKEQHPLLKASNNLLDYHCFKARIVDFDSAHKPMYIINFNYGILNRGLYGIDFKNGNTFKYEPPFIHFNDFAVIKGDDGKDYIMASSYANGNVPKSHLILAARKLRIDSLNIFTDNMSYIVLLDKELKLHKGPIGFGHEFTTQRPVYFKQDGLGRIFSMETGIMEQDTAETFRVLDLDLKVLSETQFKTTMNKSMFTKYSKSNFCKIAEKNGENIIFIGGNDSIYCFDTKQNKIYFKKYFQHVVSGSGITNLDLDQDGKNEIIFTTNGGVLITRGDLTEPVYLTTNGRIDAHGSFDKIISKNGRVAFRNITARNHYVIEYGFNKLWYFKWLLIALSFIVTYGLIYFLQIIQTRNLEQKNLMLEQLVQDRTSEIREQKLIIEEKHKEITDSINYAERIQRSFLATKELLDENLGDYFILFKPKDVVSGDFYWASKLINGNFAFVTADSTGHGVPGAIMSLLNITSLEKAVESTASPEMILNTTRTNIIERLKKDGSAEGGKDGMDCSILAFNKTKTVLQVATAQSPVWIMRKDDTATGTGVQIIEVLTDKMPVGKHSKQDTSFTLKEIELQKGDAIYTLSDGFADQFGGSKGKKFMSKKLRELLQSISQKPMIEQKEILEKVFADWVGDLEQIDDVTLVGIRV